MFFSGLSFTRIKSVEILLCFPVFFITLQIEKEVCRSLAEIKITRKRDKAMKISYNWLRDYVDFDMSAEELCGVLTSTGLEVASMEVVESVRGGLRGLVIGRVLTCVAHPGSDHLHVTTVDIGRGDAVQIVCGAPNVAAGQTVVVAPVGSVLYDGDRAVSIKRQKLRGVESCGMICAEDEIGIGTDHSGIIVIGDDVAAGTAASDYYHVDTDTVIEVEVTANRGDALSHWGVARDLYARLRSEGRPTSLHRPGCEAFKVSDSSLPIAVDVVDRGGCRRYSCVSITGCDVKPSPEWLQSRLHSVGIRPINNIVDITNYILMAYGQPLHCFDADMVTGSRIVVRSAEEGTPFVTLDGEEHTLGSQDLAICNAEEPMCIAGIFGGKGSGTYDTTCNVVLESACFDPTRIRRSARRHGLSTDSSYRFERGTDPDGVIYALKQAAVMCCELAGGRVSMEICDVYPEPAERARVDLRYDYMDSLIGKALERDKVKTIVEALEMTIEGESDEGLLLSVPTYRVDVTRPCDVVEDILRIYGYDNIELPERSVTAPVVRGEEDRKHRLETIVSEQLTGSGFNEIMNNSLTRSAYYEGLRAHAADRLVTIMNPLSNDLNVMRGTLLFGGLESIARNVNRRIPDLRLYEFGNVYSYDAGKAGGDDPCRAYAEASHLGLWLTGKHVRGSWAVADEDSSYYELKAYVTNILRRTGVKRGAVTVSEGDDDLFARCQRLSTRDGRTLAVMGIVSPAVLKRTGIACEVYYAELHWGQIVKTVRKNTVNFSEPCKYPAVSRDLALLVDKSVEFARIEDIARRTEKRLLKSVELFDVYEGDRLPAGKKSYAVNFILQDEERTLDDRRIDAVMSRLTTSLTRELPAELR